MDDVGNATVSRLIEVLAGSLPITEAREILAQDVVSHMDGFTFRGINTWARWLSYIRTRSRVGAPGLVTDRLVTNEDGTVTAYGKWKGRKDGDTALSPEVWARYRVVGGKVVEIWTTRSNYVFILGPMVGTRLGLLLVMLQVFFWGKAADAPDLRMEPAASTEPS
ncbi:MAG: hypothetical protein ACO1SX_24525 [Actinomycetota bacterium]